QFLGELSPARIPDLSARDRRKLCGQRRRPNDRHLCRAGDDAVRTLDAGHLRADQAGLRVGAGRHSRVRHWFCRELLASRAAAVRSTGLKETPMAGVVATLAGSLGIAAVSTLADFIW